MFTTIAPVSAAPVSAAAASAAAAPDVDFAAVASITVHFESHEPLVIPRIAAVTFYDLHCAIAYHIPDGVPFDMDCAMYYDREFRHIERHDMDEIVEVDFIHCILCNENLAEFFHEYPHRHVVATWPWQMDAEGEAWLAQRLLERAE